MKLLTLQEIGKKFGTDKSDLWHTSHGYSYLDRYEQHLAPMRDKKITVFELGVRDGSSLRMWKEYFPNAQIIGLDIDENCKRFEEDRIKIYIGSQNDADLAKLIVKESGGGFDVICEDASHVNSLSILSYELYWPWVKRSGFYIMEDLKNSYYRQGFEQECLSWGESMMLNKKMGIKLENHREDLDNFFNSIVKVMDSQVGLVQAMHFYSMISIIQKID